MASLTRSDLWSLEQYSEQREAFREQVLAHKKNRRLMLGEHIQLLFEDRLTIQYQIQEMLRIEKVFEPAAIQEELDAYNPLIPDGSNWKCTMLIQYQDVEERKQRLTQLLGIEDKIWIKIGRTNPVYAIADEDMERANDEKTAAVHFLRYALDAEQISAVLAKQPIEMGIDHEAYPLQPVMVQEAVRASLAEDLRD